MYNKIVQVGNLTRDIELRYASSGSAIANTAIATSRKFTQNGERKEEVCFVDITFFGRSAEVANQYLRRGSKILIEGRLKFDQWVAQDGSKRSKHSVIVENMQMLDSKADSQGGGQPQSGGYDAPQQHRQSNQNNYSGQSSEGKDGGYEYSASAAPAQKQEKKEMPEHNIPEIDIDEDEIPF